MLKNCQKRIFLSASTRNDIDGRLVSAYGLSTSLVYVLTIQQTTPSDRTDRFIVVSGYSPLLFVCLQQEDSKNIDLKCSYGDSSCLPATRKYSPTVRVYIVNRYGTYIPCMINQRTYTTASKNIQAQR